MTKWLMRTKPACVGDVAIIFEPGKRNSWPLSRITRIKYDPKTKQVRSDIKTANGSYLRPMSKVAILDRDFGERGEGGRKGW